MENKYNMKFPIRGMLHEERTMVDIHTFAINDSKDNIFISSYQDREYCIDDFIYLYIPRLVFKDIIDQVYQSGVEEGKKRKIKSKYKTSNIE